MSFTQYNPMKTQDVLTRILQKPLADSAHRHTMEPGDFLVRLSGEYAPERFAFHILDNHTLRVTENGITNEVPYACIALGAILLLSFQLPESTRGWHLVIDTLTYALTAFETWFGIEVPVGGDLRQQKPPIGTRSIPREVQRQAYFGWMDTGANKEPEALHTLTNRIEGKGLHWRYDNGVELLTFFPSVLCSTYVELSNPGSGITTTNPSDYMIIDDRYFIYARWDVEFSGCMWLNVMDFMEMKAIGQMLGFDENDVFHYSQHRAGLTLTGNVAHLEMIANNGETPSPLAALIAANGKGARYAYRPRDLHLPMTKQEARAIAKKTQLLFCEDDNVMGKGHSLPFTDLLAGRHFKVRLDNENHAPAPWTGTHDEVYEYRMLDQRRLQWRAGEGSWQEEEYVAYHAAKDLFFFTHMMTGDEDFANLSQFVDFSNGLATTVRAQIGNWHSEWEIGSRASFGVLEYEDLVPPFAYRHHFTTDLIGKSYAWNYGGGMYSQHVYSAPNSYSWTIFQEDNSGGPTWSSPGYHIKLREDAYIIQWVEENCNGAQGLMVFNPYLMHDCGFFFHIDREGLHLSITGATARDCGKLNVMRYYDKTTGI